MYKQFLNMLDEVKVTSVTLEPGVTAGVSFPFERLKIDEQFHFIDKAVLDESLLAKIFTEDIKNNPIVKEILPDMLVNGKFFYTTVRTMAGDTVDNFGLAIEAEYNSNSSLPIVAVYLAVKAPLWAQAFIPKEPRLWFEEPCVEVLNELPVFKFKRPVELLNLIRAKYYDSDVLTDHLELTFEGHNYCTFKEMPIYKVLLNGKLVGYTNTKHFGNLGLAQLLE